MALSPSGDVIVTGDSAGTIRVGRADGSEPHRLPGAGAWASLVFSARPALAGLVRRQRDPPVPVPDLSKPPLHTLPREELIAKLGSLTNVRVIEDRASPTGYELDLASFPAGRTRAPVRPRAAQEAAGSKGLR